MPPCANSFSWYTKDQCCVCVCVLSFLTLLPSFSGKVSPCNAGDPGSIPGSGRSPGEGNGNPLQYSCLENPMDREFWWATVHGVTKSRTRLSNVTSFFLFRTSYSSGFAWYRRLNAVCVCVCVCVCVLVAQLVLTLPPSFSCLRVAAALPDTGRLSAEAGCQKWCQFRHRAWARLALRG